MPMNVREVIQLLEKNGWTELVGGSEEQTRESFREALALHLEAMREIGEKIPKPTSSVDYIEVAA